MKEQKAKSPIVLDCTLRDGGYYNNWNFDAELVQKYIHAVTEAGVDIVEFGLRLPTKDGFLGASAYTSDSYLRSLKIPEGIKCAVMVNGADFLIGEDINLPLLSKTFKAKSGSPVDLVRIAINVKSATGARGLASHFKSLGYQVGFNLMQVSTIPSSELSSISEQISGWKSVDVLYFADSLGNMNNDDVKDTYMAISAHWSGPVGIHAHNNMGQALDNTLYARALGVQYLDSTVTGMGRGAGNAQTEYLIMEIEDERRKHANPSFLMLLVADVFSPLRYEHRWGENLFYRIAAKNSIHPSYVQNMLQHDNFSSEDILRALESLSDEASTSFSVDKLSGTMRARSEIRLCGKDSPYEVTSSKAVILLAAGPTGQQHLEAVMEFGKQADLPLYTINAIQHIPMSDLAGVFMSDPTRITASIAALKKLTIPLIMPKGMLSDEESRELCEIKTFDIGLQIDENLGVNDNGVSLPSLLTLGYALQILQASGVGTIYLAGFDGYKVSDPLHEVVEELLSAFLESYNGIELIAITPTSYSVRQASVYSFLQ